MIAPAVPTATREAHDTKDPMRSLMPLKQPSTHSTSETVCSSVYDDDVVLPIQKKKKRVRFATMSRQRTFRSRRDMPQEQQNLIWYNDTDFDRIRSSCKKMAHIAKNTCFAESCNIVCQRILEMSLSMQQYELELLLHDDDMLDQLAEQLLLSDSHDSFRGLEDMISQDRVLIRFQQGHATRTALLDMVESGLFPMDQMANEYRQGSLSSTAVARVTALADQIAAQLVHQESSEE